MKNTKQLKKSNSARKARSSKKRPLHIRISLHPITILFLLCVGVLMIGTTFKTLGASTSVSMSITAAAIEDPATITKPADQDRFSVPDIIISGTCPKDSYVKLYKNGAFNGVAPCVDGKFEMTTTLAKGSNALSLKVFNFSDQEGPASASITVYYDAPASAPSLTSQASSPTIQSEPSPVTDQLRILTDYKYKVHKSGQPVQLDLALAGGIAPYAVAVYWNDDKISPISRLDRSAFKTAHTYAQKPRMYTYVIKVAVSDPAGNSDYIQLMAVVDGEKPDSPLAAAVNLPSAGGNTGMGIQAWLKYLWPAYLIVVLMVLCFYLGEREERRILLGKKPKPSLR